MTDLEKFYKSFQQELQARQFASEEGDTQEQTFTRCFIELLADSGETENATVAFDEKALGTRNQHKINGYAISDNYETVDLFISIYTPEESITTIQKVDVDRAITRITNFFKKTICGNYADDVAESSEIFEFANTLASYQELKENLVRVNAIVLTNGEYKSDVPKPVEVEGYKVFYRVLDINYIYRISEESQIPIEIDFEEHGFSIPCLSAHSDNPDYQAYIAIIPGDCLATMYERFGARLLEQNVRSFLQFAGKINKGIRDTIRTEPHMFLAFNNGLALTADDIVLSEDGRSIKSISNMQIVNGGQTTASIYHVSKDKKIKVDISNVFVQAKISVIKRKDEFAEIVARISKYANTQNKVNDADFTANNPSLIEIEKLSRYIMTPVTVNNNMQTYWFFERARGQYKNLRQKEGNTKARQRAFDLKYPKSQVITKVELAKCINAYEELYDGKKLIIGPHIIVRGNEKNYAKYISCNLPDPKKINSIYFEDAIAKAILFRTADKRHGTKKNDYCIGEMKQVVVPYSIALLNLLTNGKLNLYKIWKNQCLSENLSDFMYDVMEQVNDFILDECPTSHYIEWAKKEECWEKIKSAKWHFDISEIKDDLIDPKNPPKRDKVIDISEEEARHQREIILSIPYPRWAKIQEWGRDTNCLNITQQTVASNIAYKMRENRTISAEEIAKAYQLLDIVVKHAPELLEDTDSENGKKFVQLKKVEMSDDDKSDAIKDLIRKMISFNHTKNVLPDKLAYLLADIINGDAELGYDEHEDVSKALAILVKKGFRP